MDWQKLLCECQHTCLILLGLIIVHSVQVNVKLMKWFRGQNFVWCPLVADNTLRNVTSIKLIPSLRNRIAITFRKILLQPAKPTYLWAHYLINERSKTLLARSNRWKLWKRIVGQTFRICITQRNAFGVSSIMSQIHTIDTVIIVNDFAQSKSIEASQTVSNLRSRTLSACWMAFYALLSIVDYCFEESICASQAVTVTVKEKWTLCALWCLSELVVIAFEAVFRTLELNKINITDCQFLPSRTTGRRSSTAYNPHSWCLIIIGSRWAICCWRSICNSGSSLSCRKIWLWDSIHIVCQSGFV